VSELLLEGLREQARREFDLVRGREEGLLQSLLHPIHIPHPRELKCQEEETTLVFFS
jgi:hypothetical protein